MNLHDNSTLIKALKEEKEEAYYFLVNHYHRVLYAYAVSLIDNHTIAEDIVQNVFLKTWEYRKKLNSKYSIKNFLYKSVYHEFVNVYNKKKQQNNLEERYATSLNQVMEMMTSSEIDKAIHLINNEINKLPPKRREIFILSKKEGLTNQEISQYLNISVKTVEGQITKSFKTLKNRLEKKLHTLFVLFMNQFKFIRNIY